MDTSFLSRKISLILLKIQTTRKVMAAKRKPKITLENELKNIDYNPNIGHSMTFEKAHKCARETKNLTIIMELDYWG
jgi:hypothetical protein